MREITIGTQRYTKVICLDEPRAGGACHKYAVFDVANTAPWHDKNQSFASVSFQNGAIKESGVNGCHNEDLLAIVFDRLRGFQSGKFACEENAEAMFHLGKALEWLNLRTQKRIERGVEGTLVK